MNEGGINVLFKERKKGTESEKIGLKIEQFIQNNPVEFSPSDEEKLIAEYDELQSRGLRGVVHFIHQGSDTSSPLTREIPERFRHKHYQRVHIIQTEDAHNQSRFVEPDDMVIYISQDGSIDGANQEKLDDAFRDRVGIIAGGGSGHPRDAIYVPLLKALEKATASATPGTGICLGHQFYGELLLNVSRKIDRVVEGGYFEGGVSVHNITKEGKNHPVFERLGKSVTIGSYNMYHIGLPEDVALQENVLQEGKGRVLSRNMATNYPTAFELNAAKEGQITTTQMHPELGMKGFGKYITLKDEIVKLPSGAQIVIPAGTHPDMRNTIVNDFANVNSLRSLNEKYGVDEDDVRNLLVKQIMTKNLGRDFYGPVLKNMADFTAKHRI